MAIHLRKPTFSFKIKIAKIVVIIILAKLIEETSAKDNNDIDLKKQNMTIVAIIALIICILIFEVFNFD